MDRQARKAHPAAHARRRHPPPPPPLAGSTPPPPRKKSPPFTVQPRHSATAPPHACRLGRASLHVRGKFISSWPTAGRPCCAPLLPPSFLPLGSKEAFPTDRHNEWPEPEERLRHGRHRCGTVWQRSRAWSIAKLASVPDPPCPALPCSPSSRWRRREGLGVRELHLRRQRPRECCLRALRRGGAPALAPPAARTGLQWRQQRRRLGVRRLHLSERGRRRGVRALPGAPPGTQPWLRSPRRRRQRWTTRWWTRLWRCACTERPWACDSHRH